MYFLFCSLYSSAKSVSICVSVLVISVNNPLWWKMKCQERPHIWWFAWYRYTVSTCLDFYFGVMKVSFVRGLKIPNGIMWRLLGVWVMSFPVYFNFFNFLLNTLNHSSPSRYQLISIYRKGNFSDLCILTLSCFVSGGRFYYFSIYLC